MRRLLPVLLAACTHDAPEPAPPAPPPPQVAPKPPKLVRVDHVPTYGLISQICLHDEAGAKDCLGLVFDFQRGLERTAVPADASAADRSFEVRRGRAACTMTDATLTCEGASPESIVVTEGGEHTYLRRGDTVEWFAIAHDGMSGFGEPPRLRTLPAIDGGIAQLVAGFRAACVLTREDTVWCWSDPRRPQKRATPPNIAEIAIQDPFELCVRTRDGRVSCTPAFAGHEVACRKDDLRCEVKTYDADNRSRTTGLFDPLARVAKPVAPLALAHDASKLVVDDVVPHMACVGKSLDLQVRQAGACVLGSGGEVSCLRPWEGAWVVTRVTLPAAQRVWSDLHRGYALTASGELYTWPNASESAETAPPAQLVATKLLTGVTQLTDVFRVISGPHAHEPVRCAIVDHGAGARCWRVDRETAIEDLADPRTYPVDQPRR